MKLKPAISKLLVAVAIGAVVTGLAVKLTSRPAAPLEAVEISEDLRKLLGQQQIAELNLHDASLNQAIAVLNQSLAKHPETATLRVALWTAPAPPPGFHRREEPVAPQIVTVIPGLVDPEPQSIPIPPVRPEEARLTIDLINVPFPEALRYVATLSSCVAARMGNTLYLVEGQYDAGAFGPIIERTVTFPSSTPGLGLPNDPEAVKEALRQAGVAFYEGFEIRRISPKRLLIRGVPAQMEDIDSIVEFDLTWRERLKYQLRGWWDSLREKLGFPAAGAPAPL